MSVSKQVICAIAIALPGALMLRYEITPTAHSESAYLLDRWTGEVQLLDGETRLAIKPVAR